MLLRLEMCVEVLLVYCRITTRGAIVLFLGNRFGPILSLRSQFGGATIHHLDMTIRGQMGVPITLVCCRIITWSTMEFLALSDLVEMLFAFG
jgi:hypothetical protein